MRTVVRLALAASLVAAVAGVATAGAGASPAAPTAPAAAVPAAELGSPAVTARDPGRTDLFTRSSAGHLLHQYRPAGGSWTHPVDLGGTIATQPAAVSWAPGRLDVFATGTSGALVHRLYSGGRWHGWENLGGVLTSAPAVASWQSGRLDVFGRGGGDALYHKWFVSGTGWSAWERLGGIIASSPAAAAGAVRRLDVVAVGGGNIVYRKSFTGSAWTAWERLGGITATSQPAIAATGNGVLDVFVRGTDKALWIRSRRNGAWGAWASIRGGFASGPSATDDAGAVRVVGRSPNGSLYENLRPTLTSTWPAWTRVDEYLPFRRLATWVDAFDYATLDPATAVPEMKARGVRVLNLATARFTGTTDFLDPVEAGQWLDIAHFSGIKVVGWYLPAYGDMTRDVRRTVAIANFVSPNGQRFDGVGVDIERLDEVTLAQFNLLSVQHLALVRAQTDAMLTAIVPSPFATDPGNRWAGFPWQAVGDRSDVVIPMALWSFRRNADGSPFTPDQVFGWVLDQTQRARTLSRRPVSVEGGVDDPGTENTPVTADRVSRFVDAVRAGGAIGGSHYDYATTQPAFWPILARLNG